MKHFHKVAFVSRGSVAYYHRLMLGALSFTDPQGTLITRDFRLAHDFHQVNEPGLIPAWNQLLTWDPDGIFCWLEAEPLERLIQSLPKARPIVNTSAIQSRPGVAVVTARLATMIEMTVRHLREQGLRSLAYLELEDAPLRGGRIEQFKQIARPANPAQACFMEVITSTLLEDGFAPVAPVPASLAEWLRQLPKPTGILCATGGGGGYLVRVCNDLGLRVPEEVAVVGLDDADLANACSPTLTTVLPGAQQIGRAAMELLVQMMNGKAAPTEVVRLDAMDLHVRESTGLNRAEICDIGAALGYISQHACQGITVEQLIKETQHVSKGTFLKYFQAATGQSPGQAIQQQQFDEAKRLLADTQISMTAIAECCGYCNSSSFARSFGALAGITPRDYRKQARGKRPRKK
jgi:LacI family transcriptional regulator